MKRSLLTLALVAWLGVFGWAGSIYYCSNMTGSEVEHALPFPIWDKALHFSIFAVGSFLITAAWRISTGWRWRLILPISIVAISAYGASDEYHQLSSPGRSGGDVGDWEADTLGAVAGAAICGACGFRKGRRVEG